MSEYESVIEFGEDPERRAGPPSEVKCKWATYRLNADTYERLLAKRRRGEKINFKERGGDHQFTSANRKPTPERVRDECGSGCFIIEHLFDGTAADWSFVRIAPSVTQIGSEEVIANAILPGLPESHARVDPTTALILERLERLDRDRSYSSRRNRIRNRARRPAPSNTGSQLDLVLQLQREANARERAMWEQLLEASRESQRAQPTAVEDDESQALNLILKNPAIKRRAQDALADLIDADAPDWKTELVRGLFEHGPQALSALPSVLQTLQLLGQPGQQPPMPVIPASPAGTSVPPAAALQQPTSAPSFDTEVQAVLNNMLSDLQQEGSSTRGSARDFVYLFEQYPNETK